MPAIKYKPSADCAYTQLISKIKGVHELAKVSEPVPVAPQSVKEPPIKKVPTTDVEVKKISNGLMLAQYYNSDSDEDEEEINQNKADNHLPDRTDQKQNGNSLQNVPAQEPELPIPSDVLCPPSDLRAIIEKTASYVLKNGKEFEDILRTKNDQRFTFLQYTDPYYKFYTFKLTGIVYPTAIAEKNIKKVDLQLERPKNPTDLEMKSMNNNDRFKIISKYFIRKREITCLSFIQNPIP